jgi:hypothetical protein
MTNEQQRAFQHPLIGKTGESIVAWQEPPWSLALTFNR